MSISETVARMEEPKVYTDLMIDLETLGTSANSVVLSIGAVLFDIDGGINGPTFYKNVDRDLCYKMGMEIDQGTVDWWSKQSVAARNAFTLPTPVAPAEMLTKFRSFLAANADCKHLRVWSHGSSFDLPIVQTMARRCKINVPWKYWNERDTRTLVMAVEKRGIPVERVQPEIAHNALSDAIAQARWIQKAWTVI